MTDTTDAGAADLTPEDRDYALDKLRLLLDIRDQKHAAIWEEQKHFTWIISIVLSALLLIMTTDRIEGQVREWAIIIGAALGAFLTLTGLLVQRREGVYYVKAEFRFLSAFSELFDADSPVHMPANKSVPALIMGFIRGKTGIRDNFQVMFVAFLMVFVGLVIYGIVALWVDRA